mmetsp:Transcript_1324/g.2346  ORF Transcript_1324/g.2346 Transcript_1324/m.2346 type:complete len:113 (-) Transcript_1324:257-595(-)
MAHTAALLTRAALLPTKSSARLVPARASSRPLAAPSARRSILFGAAALTVLAPSKGAVAGGFGLSDCDPICDLKITKAGNDEYAQMMASLEARKKAAAELKKAESAEPSSEK